MITINPKYKYPILEQITREDGTRAYDVGAGRLLDSVTTILSGTKTAESVQVLADWRKRVGAQEADRITNTSANLGNDMHDSLENWILRGDAPHGALLTKIMAKVIIEQGLCNVDEVWGTESKLYYPELYAGTADLIGIHSGTPAIMDFKNSRQNKKEEWIEDYFCQLVAYALSHNKLFGTNIRKGVIMMANHEGKYLEFTIEGDKFDKYEHMWLQKLHDFYSES